MYRHTAILLRSKYKKAEVAGLRSGPGGAVQLALEAVVVEAELGEGQGAVLGDLWYICLYI